MHIITFIAFSLSLYHNHPTQAAFLSSIPNHRTQQLSIQSSAPSKTTTTTPTSSHEHDSSPMPPPPCPHSNPSDNIYRLIRHKTPVSLQNILRDSGALRYLADYILTPLSIPSLITTYPSLLSRYLKLSSRDYLTVLSYGNDPQQVIHLLQQPQSSEKDIIIFIPGGAYGSGRPWMYRLLSQSFLLQNKTVAILGYRTYPDTSVDGQVRDIDNALSYLRQQYDTEEQRRDKEDGNGRHAVMKMAIIGHSTGAHISLLYLLKRATAVVMQRKGTPKGTTTTNDYDDNNDYDMPIVAFVGLSGVYDIAQHFEFERGRGVDQLSPLLPACGETMENFERLSIGYSIKRLLRDINATKTVVGDNISPFLTDGLKKLPRMLFVHGIDDTTVPYTSTTQLCQQFQNIGFDKCDELLLSGVGHVDTVFHFFIRGETEERVRVWLSSKRGERY